jgi:lipopolysaccharide transport system ATP-binding protein
MSAPPAIRVQDLGKLYRLGATTTTLAATATALARKIARRPLDDDSPVPDGTEFWALRDVSLDVPQGEVVGVVGRNGAGKSTLLKILSRITPPTTGRVEMRGDLSCLLEVGTGFHPELSGRENVFLSGAVLGMRRRDVAQRFDDIVGFAGVERFIDTPVKRYSSGMYVRLAFAVAAHLETDILLVDEVLAVGDDEFQRRCLGKMRDVVGQGRTVVFVSHNLAAVERLCPRSLWIEGGHLEADGPTGDVIDAYLRRVGSRQTGGVAVIAAEVERIGGDDARFAEAALTDRGGTPLEQVALGQAFSVELAFDLHIPIDDGVLEVGISSPEHGRVATVQNIDGARPAMALDPGRHRVRVEIDATLLPGEYSVDVALHRRPGLTLDWVERVLTFTALNLAEEGDDRWPWNHVRGALRPPSRWTLLPAGDRTASPS